METSALERFAKSAKPALTAELKAEIQEVLSPTSKARLEDPAHVNQLETQVQELGLDTVVERTTYGWFNRLAALRYMDLNGYTPCGIVSTKTGTLEGLPEVLELAQSGRIPEALNLKPEEDRQVRALLLGKTTSTTPTEDAYQILLKAACRLYARPMSYLFGDAAASPLLSPKGLLSQGSILWQVIEALDAEACKSVESLGWLYQFYVADTKDQIFASKKKRGAKEIPAATQLFTPDWICRYLVQNSLGLIWLQNNPDSALADSMEYFIQPSQETEHLEIFQAEDITVCDPASGSAHMLVYAFDLLAQMYAEEGWSEAEAAQKIICHNLFGFEIDRRAAEIGRFCLEMKARALDPAWLTKAIEPNICVLEPVTFAPGELEGAGLLSGRTEFLDTLSHLDEAGSLLVPDPADLAYLDAAIQNLSETKGMEAAKTLEKLKRARSYTQALSRTYDVVVTNPPYMGTGDLAPWFKSWVTNHYKESKADLCTCFIERGYTLAKQGGNIAMVTMHSWMFIKSFEALRKRLIGEKNILSMAHLGPRAFDAIGGEVVQTTAFVLKNAHEEGALGSYVRLVDLVGGEAKRSALAEAIQNPACGWLYTSDASRFKAIPGSPIAYWASDAMIEAFKEGTPLGDIAPAKVGLQTGDNGRFLRLWWEVSDKRVCYTAHSIQESVLSRKKWFPYNKGGDFRRWYGNMDYLVNWEDDGAEIRTFVNPKNGKLRSRPQNTPYYFRPSITWSKISSGEPSFRTRHFGSVFDVAGTSVFARDSIYWPLAALLNSSIITILLSFLSPTLNFEVGHIQSIPLMKLDQVNSAVTPLVQENISLARADWDAFETSWDFTRHPLLPEDALPPEGVLLVNQFEAWQALQESRFMQMKANEEELNRIFAEAYHMQGEVPIEVEPDKVSVRRADPVREARSLISYAVGCIMGRYSVDKEGLILADQDAKPQDFTAKVGAPTVLVDEDSPLGISEILPITEDGRWFENDLATQVERWLAGVFGAETLNANLAWLKAHLGRDLRSYLARDFFSDHVKVYKKRPIYWLFTSPKGAFRAFVYMHRYNEGTVGRVMSEYLRPYMQKLQAELSALEVKPTKTAAEQKRINQLKKDLSELESWERDVVYPLAHSRVAIDLDDGVKVNYAKLGAAVAKIKGLNS